ncbi:MAG: PadR family transcriptional regulator [bacterium]
MASAQSSPEGLPNLPATSWAVLGMLAFNEEVSGYDIKKWADWTIQHFYWSPSYSQIYSELKRLEKMRYATSRVQHDNGLRGRRLYRITESGQAAVSRWSKEAPVDPPMLKNGVLLRVWLGHINEPNRLKEILQDHVADLDRMRRRVARDARGAALEPAWAYPRLVMQWAQRYYDAERELALQMIKDIDAAEEELAKGRREAGGGFPMPAPARWREVEKWVQSQEPDA